MAHHFIMKTATIFLAILILVAVTRAEDWPTWRGPRGDAIVRETGLAEQWPTEFKPLWTAEVGIGYSSPVAKEGKVYLLTMLDKQETLICYNATGGEELWRNTSSSGFTGEYPGTRAAPTIDGDRIYTFGGQGDLIARDLATGKPIWQINILELTKSKNLRWGLASTPLIIGDNLYVQAGAGGPVAVCLNKSDGSIKWTSELTGLPSYAPAVLIDVESRPQLIIFAGKQVAAMEPDTGKTIWTVPWETKNDVHAATPIYRDGHLFITSGYGHGCMMLKVSKDAAEKLWENKSIVGRFVSPILDGDYLYGSDESGLMRCLSWPDGKLQWEAKGREHRLGIGGACVRFGNKMIALSDNGTVCLIQATPQAYERLSAIKVLQNTKEAWASPMVYNGKLYLKGATQFVCVDIAADKVGSKQ